MFSQAAKSAVLKAIALGAQVPGPQIDRVVELIHLRRLLAVLEVNLVLDVGANLGQFSKELRSIGYSGRIVSFEPVRHEFHRLSQHFAGDGNWAGHNLALGSEEKAMDIHVPAQTVMSSLLRAKQEGESVTTERVSVRRLDTILPTLIHGIKTPRVFLKMDTQGYDVEVFKGASGCMATIFGLQSELSVRPIYEGMPHYLDALQVYEEAGFDLHNLSVVNRVLDGGLLELNCFMRKR